MRQTLLRFLLIGSLLAPGLPAQASLPICAADPLSLVNAQALMLPVRFAHLPFERLAHALLVALLLPLVLPAQNQNSGQAVLRAGRIPAPIGADIEIPIEFQAQQEPIAGVTFIARAPGATVVAVAAGPAAAAAGKIVTMNRLTGKVVIYGLTPDPIQSGIVAIVHVHNPPGARTPAVTLELSDEQATSAKAVPVPVTSSLLEQFRTQLNVAVANRRPLDSLSQSLPLENPAAARLIRQRFQAPRGGLPKTVTVGVDLRRQGTQRMAGPITITVPAGATITSIDAGKGWQASEQGTFWKIARIAAADTPAIADGPELAVRLEIKDSSLSQGTLDIIEAADAGRSPDASVGQDLLAAIRAAATGALNACDLTSDGTVNVQDLQAMVNMVLQLIPCTATIEGPGVCSITGVQKIVNAILTGICNTSGSHSAALSWNASTTANVTYNVYRSATSGGPYTRLNTTPISGLSYVDGSVLAGQVYYYVATAVDGSGNESVYSNEAPATIPLAALRTPSGPINASVPFLRHSILIAA